MTVDRIHKRLNISTGITKMPTERDCGEDLQTTQRLLNCRLLPDLCSPGGLAVYNSCVKACVLPGPVCCQGLCAAAAGESVATRQEEMSANPREVQLRAVILT